MPKQYLDVWAAPCPKCHVWVGQRCRDQRSQSGLLYGRRTHVERQKKVKERVRAMVNAGTSMGTWTTTQAASTWKSWNGRTYTSITAGTTLPDYVWNTWQGAGTTSTGDYAADGIWRRWDAHTQAYREVAEQDLAEIERQVQRQRERDDAAQRRREDEAAQRLAMRERVRESEERAMALFRSLLTAEQLVDLDDPNTGCVIVRGSEGGLYQLEVDDRIHGNIVEIDDHGCVLGRLCVAPNMYDRSSGVAMPIADGYIGQLLAIRHNEDLLRVVGNWSARRSCQRLTVVTGSGPLAA
jgi:hypothetical protein